MMYEHYLPLAGRATALLVLGSLIAGCGGGSSGKSDASGGSSGRDGAGGQGGGGARLDGSGGDGSAGSGGSGGGSAGSGGSGGGSAGSGGSGGSGDGSGGSGGSGDGSATPPDGAGGGAGGSRPDGSGGGAAGDSAAPDRSDAPGGAGGDGGGAPVTCDPFMAGHNLAVCTATYLAGATADTGTAVELAPDGSVVFAGSIDGKDFGKTPVALIGGGRGVVVRLSPDGRQVLSVTRLGEKVADMEIHRPSGRIAVTGDFGVALLEAGAGALAWRVALSAAGTRVAVGSDGTVAALAADKSLKVLDAAGAELKTFAVGGSSVADIAVDGASKTVFATGFKQDDGPPCSMLQIPFLRAYDYAGTLKWKNYDWNRTEVGSVSECADSRGIALAIGRDGKLYYAGESHGGNTVHRRLPRDIATFAPNVKFDQYNDPYNLNGAAPIAYYARLDAATGALDAGQFLCTRLANGKANAARPRSITADENGNILLGGEAACCIEAAASKATNGVPSLTGYAGGGFVLIVPPDLKQRLQWASWNGQGGGAVPLGVAAGGGRMAVAMHQSHMTDTSTAPLITTPDAVQGAPGGGTSDGFLSVWRGP